MSMLKGLKDININNRETNNIIDKETITCFFREFKVSCTPVKYRQKNFLI